MLLLCTYTGHGNSPFSLHTAVQRGPCAPLEPKQKRAIFSRVAIEIALLLLLKLFLTSLNVPPTIHPPSSL